MDTPADVAKWMLEQVENKRELFQMDAASDIQRTFGDEFVYTNDNGNLAISKAVLREFRKISENTVVWERFYKLWRLRDSRDTPDRRQVDY